MNKRHINAAGLNLIKQFEGYRAKAYRDAVGVWTIGWGSTKDVRPEMEITEAEAEQRLRDDLQYAEQAVLRYVAVPLTSNEFSALVSFVFNLGVGNFSTSTLLRKLNLGDKRAAANEILRWNRAGGKVLRGLTRRRQAERELFLLVD
jgi:lysozyme